MEDKSRATSTALNSVSPTLFYFTVNTMKFVVIIALSLASLSLAAPSTQPRQGGGTNDGYTLDGGTSCLSPRPIEYGLDHLIGPGPIGDVFDVIDGTTPDLLDGTN